MRVPTVLEVADEIERVTEGTVQSLSKQVAKTVESLRAGKPVELYGFVVDKGGMVDFFRCEVPPEDVIGAYASTGEIIIRTDPPLTSARLYPTLALAKGRATHRVSQRMDKLRKHNREISAITSKQVVTLKIQ